MHEDFDLTTFNDKDVCLLRLDSPLEMNEYVQPAPMPEQGQDWEPGSIGTVSGWGDLEAGGSPPAELNAVDAPIVSDDGNLNIRILNTIDLVLKTKLSVNRLQSCLWRIIRSRFHDLRWRGWYRFLPRRFWCMAP